jgi:hypothetical protein
MAVDVTDVMPRVLAVATTMDTEWKTHKNSWGDQEPGEYNDIAIVAQHVAKVAEDNEMQL